MSEGICGGLPVGFILGRTYNLSYDLIIVNARSMRGPYL